MEIPNKLEVGQIWNYVCEIEGRVTETHIVTKTEAKDGYFHCDEGILFKIESLLDEESGWTFVGYYKNAEVEKIKKADEKIATLTRKDKVFLLNGRIAHFSLSQLVEMTDAEVDEEFEKLQTVTNSQFEGFKAVARVLVNNGYWQDGIDFNYIESVLNFRQ